MKIFRINWDKLKETYNKNNNFLSEYFFKIQNSILCLIYNYWNNIELRTIKVCSSMKLIISANKYIIILQKFLKSIYLVIIMFKK